MLVLKSRRDETHRVLRPRGERTRRAGPFAGEVIEDHALADIRAADDGGDEKSVVGELRQKFLQQQFVPFAPGQGCTPQVFHRLLELPQRLVKISRDLGTLRKCCRHVGRVRGPETRIKSQKIENLIQNFRTTTRPVRSPPADTTDVAQCTLRPRGERGSEASNPPRRDRANRWRKRRYPAS